VQSQPDVGADLSGKVIGVGGQKLDEDSPFNPGTLSLLALLVQKSLSLLALRDRSSTRTRPSTPVLSVYLLYWYKSTNTDT
jgi:hypothetical protein